MTVKALTCMGRRCFCSLLIGCSGGAAVALKGRLRTSFPGPRLSVHLLQSFSFPCKTLTVFVNNDGMILTHGRFDGGEKGCWRTILTTFTLSTLSVSHDHLTKVQIPFIRSNVDSKKGLSGVSSLSGLGL